MIPLSKPKLIWGLLGALFVSFALVSCEDLPVDVKLNVSPKEVTIPANGGSASVKFTSPVAWTASASATWVQFSPASGAAGDVTLKVSAEANPSETERTATVTVKIVDADYSESLKVIQPGNKPEPAISVSVSSVTIGGKGGEAKVSVTANAAWTAAADNTWITVSPAEGNGDASVTISASANGKTESRSGVVTFTCGTKTAAVSVAQEAATLQEIGALRGTIQDWTDGGTITMGANGQSQITDQEWYVYLPVDDKVIPMDKGSDGTYSAKVESHYATMPMLFVKGAEEIFGSVYYAAYVPEGDGTYPVSLIKTTTSAHAVYVPIDGPVSVRLDPVELKASFAEIPVSWIPLGVGVFKDGFIAGTLGLGEIEMEVMIEKNQYSEEYRMIEPYAAVAQAYPDDFEYVSEGAELVFFIKEDGSVFFKETFTGLILGEGYGEIWVMSLVPECGFSSYSYYGKWDAETSSVVYDVPAALYLSGVDKYYLTNTDGVMKVTLPAAQ